MKKFNGMSWNEEDLFQSKQAVEILVSNGENVENILAMEDEGFLATLMCARCLRNLVSKIRHF